MNLEISDWEIVEAKMDCPFSHEYKPKEWERHPPKRGHPNLYCQQGRLSLQDIIRWMALKLEEVENGQHTESA